MKVEIISIENDPSVSEWEEIPTEDLFQDGELEMSEVLNKIKAHVLIEGNWKLIRRRNYV